MIRPLLLVIAILLLLPTARAVAAEGAHAVTPAGGLVESPFAVDFVNRRIRPLLVEHCFECHGNGRHKGQVALDSLAHMLEGGESGAFLVPGDVQRSRLMIALRWEFDDEELNMPPKAKLPEADIQAFAQWVAMGAPWPLGDAPLSATATAAGTTAESASATAAAAAPTSRLPPLLGRLHPLVVHFPIACLLLAVLAEALVLVRGPTWRPLTAFLVLVGTAAAAAAVLSGTWLASGEDPALKRHELLGWTTLVGALVSSGLLWVRQRWILRLLLVATALAAGFAGHLGGALVYGKDWFAF